MPSARTDQISHSVKASNGTNNSDHPTPVGALCWTSPDAHIYWDVSWHQQLIYCDFPAQPPPEPRENGSKKRKCPVSNNHVDGIRTGSWYNVVMCFGLLSGTSTIEQRRCCWSVASRGGLPALHLPHRSPLTQFVPMGKLKVGQCVCRGDLIALTFSVLLSWNPFHVVISKTLHSDMKRWSLGHWGKLRIVLPAIYLWKQMFYKFN